MAPLVTGLAPAATAPVSARPTGTHRAPAASDVSAPAGSLVASPASAATAGQALLLNFNGTSSRDSEVTNFNAKFEPPDQGLCAGNGFVLEPVNSAYNIYRADGKRLRGPFNVNDLFNEGAAEFTSDPRCFFDAPTHTWFAAILFINSDSTLSRSTWRSTRPAIRRVRGPGTRSIRATTAGSGSRHTRAARAWAISHCSASTRPTSI
jgi:hypothetical protein